MDAVAIVALGLSLSTVIALGTGALPRRGAVGPMGPAGPAGPRGDQGLEGVPGTLRFDVEKLTDDEVARIAERVTAAEGAPDPVTELDSDPVNHPAHYVGHPVFGDIEAIEVTERMCFTLGNAVKYLWRAGRKGGARQDVEKAVWYLNRSKVRNGSHPLTETLQHRLAHRPHTMPGEDRVPAGAVVSIVEGVAPETVARNLEYWLDAGLFD